MSDTEDISKEEQEFFNDVRCSLNISLLTSDEVEFDFFYKDKESLKSLCQIIMMIQKSDFLINALISEDISEEEKNTILEFFSSNLADALDDGEPIVYPIDVYRHGGDIIQ